MDSKENVEYREEVEIFSWLALFGTNYPSLHQVHACITKWIAENAALRDLKITAFVDDGDVDFQLSWRRRATAEEIARRKMALLNVEQRERAELARLLAKYGPL